MMSVFSTPHCAPAAQSGFTPLFRLLSDFDNYNREVQGPQRHHRRASPRTVSFKPKFDVRETETSYELHGELPGIERDNIKIEFTDDQTILVRGRVERTYDSRKPETEAETETEKVSTGGEEAAVDNSDNHSTHSWHHATVEDDPEDENAASTVSATQATPAETPKTEVAQPAAVAPEVKTPAQNRKYWLLERSVGEFSRAFTFPTRVDQEDVTASLDNGILTVSVPKAKKHEVRRISIN